MRATRLSGFTAFTAAVIIGLTIAGCSKQAAAPIAAAPSSGAAQGAPISDPSLVLPVAANPIVNDATKPGLQITSAMVENNVDPVTKKDLSDRLQISIKNTSAETIVDPEVFYQMTDSTTKKTEGYFQKLTGFTLAPGETGTVYFDNGSGAGHYPENLYSLYRTSKNEVVISIEVSSAGYAPAMGETKKGPGTGEVAGE